MPDTRLLPLRRRATPASPPAMPESMTMLERRAARLTTVPATARGAHPSVPHLIAFCALWLAVFVWAVPAAGTLLARQTAALSTGAVNSLVRHTAQPHALWQVGVQAGADDTHATAMRATIGTRLPQHVAANTTSYYWVGSYLADGSFIQVGYYVPWYQSDQAGWFYCAFTRAGAKGPCAYGPLGSVAGTGSAHTYALAAASGPGGQPIWSATLDGRPLGSFAWSAGDTGAAGPSVYAESSATRPHAAESILGPVAVGGFAVRPDGAVTYRRVSVVYPAYSAGDVCPPYGVRALGRDSAVLGSGLGCPNPLVALW